MEKVRVLTKAINVLDDLGFSLDNPKDDVWLGDENTGEGSYYKFIVVPEHVHELLKQSLSDLREMRADLIDREGVQL